jgi:hypothetical protein
MDEDADDTIPADPDEDEPLGASFTQVTDGKQPDENREVGSGVGEDG